jgi:hypothetical protein
MLPRHVACVTDWLNEAVEVLMTGFLVLQDSGLEICTVLEPHLRFDAVCGYH